MNENNAIVPVPKLEDDSYDFYERHAAVLACKDKINPQAIVIGDSITHHWGGSPFSRGFEPTGQVSFDTTFANIRALNLGFGFDRTQNAIWRLQNGEVDGLRPSLAVVNIGTNNLRATAHARENTASEICAGVEQVCLELEKRCPGVRIVVMCVFPRGRNPDDPLRLKTVAVNEKLVPMTARHGYRCINIGSLLLNLAGELTEEISPDGTHLTAKGYEIWGNVIRPLAAAVCRG